MPCSNTLYPRQHSDAGLEWRAVDFRESEVLILFDGSESSAIASGTGTRGQLMAEAIGGIVEAYQRRIAFGLLHFPDATACGDGAVSGCCVGAPSVELALGQGAAIRAALAARAVPYGSSPMRMALETAISYFQSRPFQGESRTVLLATNGQPGCDVKARDASVDEGACQDAARIVQAMAKLEPPIRTLVFSPGSRELVERTECLRRLGAAASANQTDDASWASEGFTTDDAKSLEKALEATFLPDRLEEPSCEVKLGPEPTSNARFSVYVDGQMIPEDDDNGWEVRTTRASYESPVVVSVSLTGEYCRRLKQHRFDQVQVTYDCRIARLDGPHRGGRRYCKT